MSDAATAGLEQIHERIVQNPITNEHEKLFLAQLVPNMRAAIVGAGVMTEPELEQLHADLVTAAHDPSTCGTRRSSIRSRARARQGSRLRHRDAQNNPVGGGVE